MAKWIVVIVVAVAWGLASGYLSLGLWAMPIGLVLGCFTMMWCLAWERKG